MPQGLWTPDGVLPVGGKDEIPISRAEIQNLAFLQDFSQREGVSLVCNKCNQSIVGQNNDSSKRLSVACHCRCWSYTL